MRRMLLALMIVLFSTSSMWAGDPVADAEVMLKEKFPADKPGAAVLILKAGEPVLMKGFGLADMEKKTPITPDTQFDLASVSKQFTAMAVMILADQGKLKFDDPITKWIPEMPEMETPRPITIRDLLCHTSGLIDYLNIFKGNDEEFAKLKNTDVPALFKGKKLRQPPGTKFEYSNTNYALLPIIVERASGKPFSTFAHENIFQPLGMKSTKIMDKVPYDVENRANGYGRKMLVGKLEVSRRDGPICGDGNVFCTARDFIQWDAALTNCKLVKKETQELAFSPNKLDDGKETNYGFGWGIRVRDGKKVLSHGGGWAGTRTSITRWLHDPLTIVILSNDEGAKPDQVANELAKLFRPPAN